MCQLSKLTATYVALSRAYLPCSPARWSTWIATRRRTATRSRRSPRPPNIKRWWRFAFSIFLGYSRIDKAVISLALSVCPSCVNRSQCSHFQRPYKCSRAGCYKAYIKKAHLVRHDKVAHSGVPKEVNWFMWVAVDSPGYVDEVLMLIFVSDATFAKTVIRVNTASKNIFIMRICRITNTVVNIVLKDLLKKIG